MKRLVITLCCIVLILCTTGYNSGNSAYDGTEPVLEQDAYNETETVSEQTLYDGTEPVSEQSFNNTKCAKNGFYMDLFSDKQIYKTTEPIKIWATLKYAGDSGNIEIWHGDPYMVFSISDGKNFNSDGIVRTILMSTILERDKLYHFDYKKSGSWDTEDSDAEFWERFYEEESLLLPKGEYTITLNGGFSISEDSHDHIGLTCKLKIKVKK